MASDNLRYQARQHFTITPKIWDKLFNINPKPQPSSFVEEFYDDQDFTFLKNNCWLLRRYRDNPLESEWKLKICISKTNDKIE